MITIKTGTGDKLALDTRSASTDGDNTPAQGAKAGTSPTTALQELSRAMQVELAAKKNEKLVFEDPFELKDLICSGSDMDTALKLLGKVSDDSIRRLWQGCFREMWGKDAFQMALLKHIAAMPDGKELLRNSKWGNENYQSPFMNSLFPPREERHERLLSFLISKVEDGDFITRAGKQNILDLINDQGSVAKYKSTIIEPLLAKITDPDTKLYYRVKFNLADPSELNADSIKIHHPQVPEETILHVATEAGDGELVSRLIKLGADKKPRDSRGMIPLHHAIAHDNLASVKALIKANADIHATVPFYFYGKNLKATETALHLAARSYKNSRDIIACLINAGVSNKAKDSLGRLALHACFNGNGSNSNQGSLNQKDPELISLLTKGLSAADLQYSSSPSILESAVKYPGPIEVLEILFNTFNSTVGLTDDFKRKMSDDAVSSAYRQFDRNDHYGTDVRNTLKFIMSKGLLHDYSAEEFKRALGLVDTDQSAPTRLNLFIEYMGKIDKEVQEERVSTIKP